MIGKDLESEILRLYHAEKWRVNTISRQLGVHHTTVRRVITQENTTKSVATKPRITDPYVPFLKETLEKYPSITASRLYDMAKARGFNGKPSHFRAVISELRYGQRSAEPFLRLKTLPGEQAQVDWGHFGHVMCGKANRPLMAFVIVLSYSRAIFLRFFLSHNLSSFLYGHELAFRWFGGIARVCLYDNLKSVVLERAGTTIRFNRHFLDFAGHCRFEPRPVAVARGNEKGRTERAIRYIRTNFFAARRFRNLDDLNHQALAWCEGAALQRRWPEDQRQTVAEAFTNEKPHLLSLPETQHACEERREVSVGKTPYVRFDLNDYSVPPEFVQKTLTVFASLDTVRILDRQNVVATHFRSYDRKEQITDPAHLEALKQHKTRGSHHSRTHLLSEVAPSSTTLLEQVAARGLPLGRATNDLLSLLNIHGPALLEDAIKEALSSNAPHPQAVRHILERLREPKDKAPPLQITFLNDPRFDELHVKTGALSNYDHLLSESDDESTDTNS